MPYHQSYESPCGRGDCGPEHPPKNPECYVQQIPHVEKGKPCCPPDVPENPCETCRPIPKHCCPPDSCCEFNPCCPCPRFIHPSRCWATPKKCVRLPRPCPQPCVRPAPCCPPKTKCKPCEPCAPNYPSPCKGEAGYGNDYEQHYSSNYRGIEGGDEDAEAALKEEYGEEFDEGLYGHYQRVCEKLGLPAYPKDYKGAVDSEAEEDDADDE